MHSKILEQLRPRPLYYTTHRQQEAAGDPVGAAFSGPAFGERRGPAVAIFGAYASISAGIAIGAGTLMGGLMIAGGVMSGLGAITGNKTLSTLGMVTGLAGGVGQFFRQGGFESFGNAFSAGDGISGGLENMADQFTGNANFAVDPSGMAPVTDAANPLMNQTPADAMVAAGNPTVAQQVLRETGAAVPGWSNAAAQGMGINTAPGAKASTPGAKDTGLLGMWNGSGDFTKMAMINAGAGALKGMGEASTAEDKMEAEKPFMDAQTQNVDAKTQNTEAQTQNVEAQTAAIEKKNAGVPMVSIGSFGTNQSEAFGKNANGTTRTYAEYIADRTAAMQRLFGTQQAAPAA